MGRAEEVARLLGIMRQYQDKNFVKRILDFNPNLPPEENFVLRMGKEGPGSYGTHLMGYSTNPNGGFMVYPHIVEKRGMLMNLSPEEAYRNALSTNEYIPFQSQEDADWFGRNYKKVWGSDW